MEVESFFKAISTLLITCVNIGFYYFLFDFMTIAGYSKSKLKKVIYCLGLFCFLNLLHLKHREEFLIILITTRRLYELKELASKRTASLNTTISGGVGVHVEL